jgi:hypothetical protein
VALQPRTANIVEEIWTRLERREGNRRKSSAPQPAPERATKNQCKDAKVP